MFKNLALAILLSAACGIPAFATPVFPGDLVLASPISTTQDTLNAVSPVINGSISPGTFTAFYGTGVFTDTANAFCSGCLDFVIGVVNVGDSGSIEHVSEYDFTGLTLNVGYMSDPASAAPVSIERSSAGDVVTFNFLPTNSITIGNQSSFLVIQTNATSYTDGGVSISDTSAVEGPGFQPTSVTPEPSSFTLLGTGLLAAANVIRRRFNQ